MCENSIRLDREVELPWLIKDTKRSAAVMNKEEDAVAALRKQEITGRRFELYLEVLSSVAQSNSGLCLNGPRELVGTELQLCPSITGVSEGFSTGWVFLIQFFCVKVKHYF